MGIYNLISFLGIFILLGFAWLISANRKIINLRVVIWGIAIQLAFALIVFIFPAGTQVFLLLNSLVVKALDAASFGTKFLFGRLALPPGAVNEAGETSLGFILAFQAFPTIVFFSALMSVLYYFNFMSWIIRGFAYVFTKLMRVSGAESLCAASNVFTGVESALIIKPHLGEMTTSELCTVLTAGMATVSANVMGFYIYTLKDVLPTIAGHLVCASILSATGSLVMSKLIVPEDDVPKTLGESVKPHYEREGSLFAAIINGAQSGIKLIVGVVALLLAILGLVALLDTFLCGIGWRLNGLMATNLDWSLKGLMGYLFYPFTLILGVPSADAWTISRIIGERTILTEVVSYQELATVMSKHLLSNPRSAIIAVYAICGFAHIASMSIFIGGTAALAPGKIKELSAVGIRSLVAATLACLLSACIAGIFL